MRDGDNIMQLDALPVDMIGFIFYHKSPRFVYEMPHFMPKNSKKVGVFVDEPKESVQTYADRFELDYVQLHGNESPEYCRSLQANGLKIIKAFSVADVKDLKQVNQYEPSCRMFVFDTKSDQPGGSGKQFDWDILEAYHGETPFLLSGGINCYSARALKEFHHPALIGYDLNSRFELKPALKDIERIETFLNDLKLDKQTDYE